MVVALSKHLCYYYYYYYKSGNSPLEVWSHMSSAISRNTQITDKNNNRTQLCSLHIKTLNPALSVGIKATKELNLFR